MKLLASSLCLSAILASGGISFADTLTLNPTADTFTRTGVNAGSSTILDLWGQSSGAFMAYLQFDLSSLPSGATIDSATYTLYKEPWSRDDTITTGRFANFGLLDVSGNTPQNWDEATLAEGNEGQEYGVGSYSALTSSVTSGYLYNLDADNGANVTETVNNVDGTAQTLTGPDLATFLTGQVADGGLATFISAINDTGGRGWAYASKENSDSTIWPSLTITYTPVPEPSTLALIGLGVVGLVVRQRRKA